jgi:hypothetical protein
LAWTCRILSARRSQYNIHLVFVPTVAIYLCQIVTSDNNARVGRISCLHTLNAEDLSRIERRLMELSASGGTSFGAGGAGHPAMVEAVLARDLKKTPKREFVAADLAHSVSFAKTAEKKRLAVSNDVWAYSLQNRNQL